jgi:hypothetical protein
LIEKVGTSRPNPFKYIPVPSSLFRFVQSNPLRYLPN